MDSFVIGPTRAQVTGGLRHGASSGVASDYVCRLI